MNPYRLRLFSLVVIVAAFSAGISFAGDRVGLNDFQTKKISTVKPKSANRFSRIYSDLDENGAPNSHGVDLTGFQKDTERNPEGGTYFTVSPHGKYVASLDSESQDLKLFDSKHRLVHDYDGSDNLMSMLFFSENDNKFFSYGKGFELFSASGSVWSVTADSAGITIPNGVAISPDGTYVVLSGVAPKRLAEKQVLVCLGPDGKVAWNKDGEYLITPEQGSIDHFLALKRNGLSLSLQRIGYVDGVSAEVLSIDIKKGEWKDIIAKSSDFYVADFLEKGGTTWICIGKTNQPVGSQSMLLAVSNGRPFKKLFISEKVEESSPGLRTLEIINSATAVIRTEAGALLKVKMSESK